MKDETKLSGARNLFTLAAEQNNATKQKQEIRADEALKAVFASDTGLLVRFVNSVFKTTYDTSTAEITFLKTEFVDTTIPLKGLN